MNEKANEVLAQLMQRALDGVNAAAEFSQQQIPEVVQQLLTWVVVSNFAMAAISLVYVVAYFWIFVRSYEKCKATEQNNLVFEMNAYRNEPELNSGFAIPYVMGGGFLCVISGVVFIASLHEAMKVLIAPKLYLLEYGASLIK